MSGSTVMPVVADLQYPSLPSDDLVFFSTTNPPLLTTSSSHLPKVIVRSKGQDSICTNQATTTDPPSLLSDHKSTQVTTVSNRANAVVCSREAEPTDKETLIDLPLTPCTKKLVSTSSTTSAAQCRICFSASGDTLASGKAPVLVHPCACDGSIRFCHPECLLQWVRQSGSFVCELCKTRYQIKRSGLKRFTQWRMPPTDSIDWIHMVIFFFSVSFIVGSIVWMTWLGLGQRLLAPGDPLLTVGRTYDAEAAGTLGDFMVPAFILYSIIDVLFLFIAGMELIFTISPLAKKWYRMNQKLVIENFDNMHVCSGPRMVNSNVISASALTSDVPGALSVQASIPCVNEERERFVQEHNSLF